MQKERIKIPGSSLFSVDEGAWALDDPGEKIEAGKLKFLEPCKVTFPAWLTLHEAPSRGDGR